MAVFILVKQTHPCSGCSPESHSLEQGDSAPVPCCPKGSHVQAPSCGEDTNPWSYKPLMGGGVWAQGLGHLWLMNPQAKFKMPVPGGRYWNQGRWNCKVWGGSVRGGVQILGGRGKNQDGDGSARREREESGWDMSARREREKGGRCKWQW